MKLYYFMIIMIGLMYTFSLAGIETGSNDLFQKMNILGENLNDTVINPTLSSTTEYDTQDISNASYYWAAFVIAMIVIAGAGVLGSVEVLGSGFNTGSFLTAVVAVLSSFIYGMFATDLFSILKLMYEITGGSGWQFHLTWILIVPILFAFPVSLIQFIKGNE